MMVGQIIEIVATYLLSRLNIDTPTTEWATYLVLSGLGLGMGQQIPYIAVQVVLRYTALNSDHLELSPAPPHISFYQVLTSPTSPFSESDVPVGNGQFTR